MTARVPVFCMFFLSTQLTDPTSPTAAAHPEPTTNYPTNFARVVRGAVVGHFGADRHETVPSFSFVGLKRPMRIGQVARWQPMGCR
jgi:hypothetical protein